MKRLKKLEQLAAELIALCFEDFETDIDFGGEEAKADEVYPALVYLFLDGSIAISFDPQQTCLVLWAVRELRELLTKRKKNRWFYQV